MQYRAIGLVRGVYVPSEEQFTRGNLMTEDETCINAVLLGRIMSLVKNHLDIEKEHLWVVYPRTRSKDGELHAQIVGVWEPETLDKEEEDAAIASAADSETETPPISDGYFSVRGEIIYHSQAKESTVVRIVQSPRKNDKKPRFFKVELKGSVVGKAVGHFWDFHALRQGTELAIQQAEEIGQVPNRRKKRPYSKKPRRRYGSNAGGGSTSSHPTNRPSRPSRPIRKPVPRSAKASEGADTPPPQPPQE